MGSVGVLVEQGDVEGVRVDKNSREYLGLLEF